MREIRITSIEVRPAEVFAAGVILREGWQTWTPALSAPCQEPQATIPNPYFASRFGITIPLPDRTVAVADLDAMIRSTVDREYPETKEE